MRNVRRSTRRVVAAASTIAVAALAAGQPSAMAASTAGGDNVDVVNTETVQVYMGADGHIESRRVYEQLVLTGNGKVTIKNPVSTKGLRNLDGFGGFDVKDGEQVGTFNVDGVTRARSVSDFTGTLPLDIDVAYSLNGKTVKPGDVVGEDGKLKVDFTVKNITSESRQVTIPDGKGGTVTRTVDVAIPMVGSLTTVAPSTFTEVKSDQANMAGDGKGGTKLTFTMTLFPPIGAAETTFGYTASIKDGVVPEINVSALPVNPLKSPSFKTAATSYQSGADTGAQLADGALEIDGNLLKLRDGASDLLAGLLKLHAGSEELQDGLVAKAAPGARKLADGTGKAVAGSDKVASGAGELSAGLGKADAGGTRLDSGATQLAAGQKALAAGLEKLYAGVDSLPAQVQAQVTADPQYQALTGALSAVLAGIGTLADQPQANPANNTLLGGLNGLKYGLRYPAGADCVNAPATKCGIIDGIDTVKAGIDAQLAGSGALGSALLAARTSAGCAADPVCAGNLDAIIPGLSALPAKLQQASAALGALSDAGDDRMIPGINLMRSRISTGVSPATCSSNPSGCGAREALLAVQGGIPLLVQAVSNNIRTTLLAAIGTGGAGCDTTKTLQCGANALSAGTLQLSAGITELVSGIGLLSDGGSRLAAGAGDLADGLDQIDGGANDLADGLGDAADGSKLLADGLGEAVAGAPKLVEGAGRLSKEGTQVIAGKGEETAQNYGTLYAVLAEGAKRADAERMAYGAPKDAMGLTAYTYVIKADDGEGGRNLVRTLGGLGLLAAGGGVLLLRRRLF
jgi:putative membrane protein